MAVERLEQVVRNIDVRLTRVEQILPTLATKKDLEWRRGRGHPSSH